MTGNRSVTGSGRKNATLNWKRDTFRIKKEEGESRTKRGGRRSEGLSFQDRLRLKIIFAPPVMFFYLLFGRGLILDGWPGWFYVGQRTIAEVLLSAQLLTSRKRRAKG